MSVLLLAALAACTNGTPPPATHSSRPSGPPTHSHPPTTASSAAPSRPHGPAVVTLVTAGDVACNPLDRKFDEGQGEETGCRQRDTANLIGRLHPDALMPLGDNQYQRGTYQGFITSYAPTWGRYLRITHPVIGNHEYMVPHANGYFRYFGRLAGNSTRGYYSFDLGRWHIVVLNDSGCRENDRCRAGSPQERWLRADLAAHPADCTLAAWHEPRWSSGEHHDNPGVQPLWADLYAAGVEISLAGHDHDYERFLPLNARGRPDPAHGIQEFVVGTGGVGLRPFRVIDGTSVVHQSTSFGLLHLTLRPKSYDYRFVPVGNGFHDSGHRTCH